MVNLADKGSGVCMVCGENVQESTWIGTTSSIGNEKGPGQRFRLTSFKAKRCARCRDFFHYSAIAQGCLALTLLFPSLRIGETL